MGENAKKIGEKQAVLIECKNRQMQSITASSVKEWVQEIINNVECTQSATELKDANIDTSVLSTGLLIIHANDSTHSDYQIDDILKGLSAPNRRNPINIFIATNRELSMWTSMFQFIENTFSTGDFMFVYPSINNMGKEHLKHISINSLYSKYVFAQHKYPHEYVDGNRKITETKESNIMFSFDDISMDSFRYMWSMFKYYQMQGSNDYKFCFYPRKSADTQLLTKENFINAIIQDDVEFTTEAVKFLKSMAGNSEESAFSLIHINLLSLPPKSSVVFFERVMKTDFEHWKLKTITGITLKKADSVYEENEDDETEEDEGEVVTEEALAGISQAALQGNGLQNNQFVKDTLDQGYIISSMRFRYTCKLEAEEFAIVISCKGTDLRIDIDKTYCEEGERLYVSPFSRDRQDEIILIFQNIANSICSDLRRELSEIATT